MASFQPSDKLWTRTFIGLLAAQFLAAFNDQAINASAMFFAMKTGLMGEKEAISLMMVFYYAPWAIFCTIAGWLADRYSKRNALVLWKVIEVGITLVALAGFWMGRGGLPAVGPWVVTAAVFGMGLHSAFFVPAKYGAMPEIMQRTSCPAETASSNRCRSSPSSSGPSAAGSCPTSSTAGNTLSGSSSLPWRCWACLAAC